MFFQNQDQGLIDSNDGVSKRDEIHLQNFLLFYNYSCIEKSTAPIHWIMQFIRTSVINKSLINFVDGFFFVKHLVVVLSPGSDDDTVLQMIVKVDPSNRKNISRRI